MLTKALLVLAAMLNCTLAALAAEPQPTGGTASLLNKSSTASNSSQASIDAYWDAFMKRPCLDARPGFGRGMAWLLKDTPNAGLSGVVPLHKFQLPDLPGLDFSGLKLKQSGNTRSSLELMDDLRHGTDSKCRRAAAEALGKLRCDRATEALSDAVHDSDPSVREAAFHALGAVNPYRAVWARWKTCIIIVTALVAVWLLSARKYGRCNKP